LISAKRFSKAFKAKVLQPVRLGRNDEGPTNDRGDTRAAYLEGGLDHAVADVQRPGKPRRYRTEVEAQITALACSARPTGAKRWTLLLLERAARAQPGMRQISRETIRRLLKKTVSNRGAG